jgi:MFS family permease
MFILKPLADRPIACLWGAQLLSATGAEFYMVAVIWLASAFIGNDAGYVPAMQSAALLAGSIFGGVITDRWPYGATMIGSNLVRAGLLMVLSTASALGLMSISLLAITAVLIAVATAVYDPALQVAIHILVPEQARRHTVNGLFDATRRMARILGPSLIALVSGLVPVGQFFAVTAAGFLCSAIGVQAGLKGTAIPAPATGGGLPAVVDTMMGGIRAIRGHAVMYYGLGSGLIGNIAWAMAVLLGMVLHLRATSAEPLTDYGLMMTAYGVGNLAANLVLSGMRPRRPIVWLVISKLTFGLGVLLMPLAPDRTWLMAFAAFAAINGPFENLAMLHIIQHDFPPRRIAQVFRLQMCATFGGMLLGYLAAPVLFDAFGFVPMIAAAGALTLATGIGGLFLVFR